MEKQSTLVIEHCEPELSEWLMLEYRHAVKLWRGKTIVTNVRDEKTTLALSVFSRVEKKTANEIFCDKNCLILDPQAEKPLKTKDFSNLDALIVGGILGYEKPRGRTRKLLSDKSRFETRNLGSIQLSIDGAVFVAKAIMLGMRLSDIEIAYEIEIAHNSVHSTILPFGYPVIDNTPMVTPGLIGYLTRE
jgi:ribosome biogenesis SPOUT family RNA methylase Rps3